MARLRSAQFTVSLTGVIVVPVLLVVLVVLVVVEVLVVEVVPVAAVVPPPPPHAIRRAQMRTIKTDANRDIHHMMVDKLAIPTGLGRRILG